MKPLVSIEKCPRCKQNAIREIISDADDLTCFHCGYKHEYSVANDEGKSTFSAGVLHVIHNEEKDDKQVIILFDKDMMADYAIKVFEGYFPEPIEKAYITYFEDGSLHMTKIK